MKLGFYFKWGLLTWLNVVINQRVIMGSKGSVYWVESKKPISLSFVIDAKEA